MEGEGIGNDAIRGFAIAHGRALALAIANDFSTAELAFVAVRCVVLFHLRYEAGVAEAHAVSGRRAVHVGVVAPIDRSTHWAPPLGASAPAVATRRTVFSSPGSKRTAVPARMSRRIPAARFRSNTRARFVSSNG